MEVLTGYQTPAQASEDQLRGHLLHKTGTPPKHFSRECIFHCFSMFDLRKIFDLRKFFAVPKNFLKSKIHCTTSPPDFQTLRRPCYRT